MPDPLLSATGLIKKYGAIAANDGVTFEVQPGTVHALIGPNGAGKSTAIALLSGEVRPDEGRIVFAGGDITAMPAYRRARTGLKRSYQITSLFPAFTALDNVAMALQAVEPHAFRFFAPARKDRALREAAAAWLERLHLKNAGDTRVSDLSHGERRQLELAMVLAGEPAMVLLDEPMAGMGRAESDEIVGILKGIAGDTTILLVEHDMDVVFSLADAISVMVKGQVIASGAPDAIRADADVQAAYLGDA